MTIQINTNKSLNLHEAFDNKLKGLLSTEFGRFEEHLTRLEVHLSDENGSKDGPNDKRCMIEARLKGRRPIAVTNLADTHDKAVNGAIDKLKASLETILERLQNH